MSGWIPRVYGCWPGSPRRSTRSPGTSSSVYSCLISIPESVNRRGSSGPTIGAIVRCSSAVAIASEVTGGQAPGPLQHLPEKFLGALMPGVVEHIARLARLDHDALVDEHHRVGDLARE